MTDIFWKYFMLQQKGLLLENGSNQHLPQERYMTWKNELFSQQKSLHNKTDRMHNIQRWLVPSQTPHQKDVSHLLYPHMYMYNLYKDMFQSHELNYV